MTENVDWARFQDAWGKLSPDVQQALSDIVEGLQSGELEQSAAMAQLASLNVQP